MAAKSEFKANVADLLKARGYEVKDDKSFGKALSDFQGAEGLTVNGALTKETIDALHEVDAVPLPPPAATDMRAAGAFGEPEYSPIPNEGLGLEPLSSAGMAALHLTPQEQNLYEWHINNLKSGNAVHNPDGSTSTLLQMVEPVNGKWYNIPSVWGGKTHTEDQAYDHAESIGWDHWPSYPTQDAAEQRYGDMHGAMELDVLGAGDLFDRGLTESGNIDVSRRWLSAEKGGGSTMRTISIDHNGETVLLPTVTRNGEFLNDGDAIDHYLDSGEHLGKFASPEGAADHAALLHANEIASFYPDAGIDEPGAGHRHVDVRGANSPFKDGIETVVPKSTTNYRPDFVNGPAFDDNYVQKWSNGAPPEGAFATDVAVGAIQRSLMEGKTLADFSGQEGTDLLLGAMSANSNRGTLRSMAPDAKPYVVPMLPWEGAIGSNAPGTVRNPGFINPANTNAPRTFMDVILKK